MLTRELLLGDCVEVLKGLADCSVDSIVTDPPYGLSFMGKKWDYDVPSVEVWAECLRVLKPGGHLLAFAGTRTQHRMAVRIEDAGFEIRDMIAWVYGSGFPKSLDVSKAIDKTAGAEREVVGVAGKSGSVRNSMAGDFVGGEYMSTAPATPEAQQWQGWGTALKPALEPITVARKPLGEKTVAANVLEHGTGAINVDGCRVGTDGGTAKGNPPKAESNGIYGHGINGACDILDIGKGRWPANLIHDGSDEVVGLFPANVKGAVGMKRVAGQKSIFNLESQTKPQRFNGAIQDTGSAARFFKSCQPETLDLLFCRAKAILHAWQLNQKIVSAAELNSCLSRQAAAFVLSNAVIAASQGGKLLSDVKGLSTTVTERECEMLCETLTTAILILESDALLVRSPVAPIQNGCLVNIATTPKQTGTTTITISLPKSGGYAEPVMFSITPMSAEHGEADFASRFRYCAKASKKDRDEGCEHLPEHQEGLQLPRGKCPDCGTWKNAGEEQCKCGGKWEMTSNPPPKARNNHPTVKPTALMRYLCRLVTPPEGIVLDPFMGSGSTGKAALLEGFRFIGIERDKEYMKIAEARIKAQKCD
jgi:DNA modification methylase